ncbi:MAG: HNH endonuclease [Chitinophagia bacterium]|nr:HNH endonuclease [Chitinophagia bacterium]
MALESTELTKDLLHTLFDYEDGKLYWKGRRNKEAGSVGNRGYRCICINYRKYMAHRLIWIMHGNDPVEMLDHIDGDQLNNRIENLRPVTNSQNQRNQKLRKDNTSGIKGVSWLNAHKRWAGQVWHKGKLYRAGYFKDKDECAAAVRELREKLHGEFARH